MIAHRKRSHVFVLLATFVVARLVMTIPKYFDVKVWIFTFGFFWWLTVIAVGALWAAYSWRPFPHKMTIPLIVAVALIVDATVEFGYAHYIVHSQVAISWFWRLRVDGLYLMALPALIAGLAALIVYRVEHTEVATRSTM